MKDQKFKAELKAMEKKRKELRIQSIIDNRNGHYAHRAEYWAYRIGMHTHSPRAYKWAWRLAYIGFIIWIGLTIYGK